LGRADELVTPDGADARARLVALLRARSILHGDFLLASGRRSPY
jgi:orotate phosphoribosyltransferase